MSHTGFAVLAWVKDECELLNQCTTEDARIRVIKQLLTDFNILIGMRWNMEMTLPCINGNWYAYGNNTRITVSNSTIRNAIGDLTQHLDFLRGTSHSTAEDLANFKICKEKWRVPEQVTDTSSGWELNARAETFHTAKRQRF